MRPFRPENFRCVTDALYELYPAPCSSIDFDVEFFQLLQRFQWSVLPLAHLVDTPTFAVYSVQFHQVRVNVQFDPLGYRVLVEELAEKLAGALHNADQLVP